MSTDSDNPKDPDEILFEEDAERQWAESPSLGGVDPDLMNARRGKHPPAAHAPEAAAFSPILIPFSALVTGPIVAALLTILTDGRPPRPRHAVAVFSIGSVAWLINQGMDSIIGHWVSPAYQTPYRLGVLAATGAILWAIYRFWIKGRRAQDQKTLTQSLILLVVLSGAYWFGQDMSWWQWLGR